MSTVNAPLWKRTTNLRLFWPIAGLALLLLFNFFFTPRFFHLEIRDGHLYGTPRAFVEEQLRRGLVVVLEVDVQGGAAIRRAHPSAVSVFVAPPSVAALRERLLGRGADRPEVVEARLGNAPAELAQMSEYDYLLLNDEVERATARLIAIVDAERVRVARLRATP